MLIPDLLALKLALVLLVINLLENILKSSIILLQNRVLGTHIQRQALAYRQLETSMCKSSNTLICVVLSLRNSAAILELENFDFLRFASLWRENYGQFAIPWDNAVRRAILVSECVTADDDGLLPAGYETGDSRDNDGFSEDCAS
jgi:hypothetical protein